MNDIESTETISHSASGIIAIIGAVFAGMASLAASAVLVIGALNETNEAVERSAQSQDKKLDKIHDQTNSNLSVLRAELKVAMAELASAREDLALLAGRKEAEEETEE